LKVEILGKSCVKISLSEDELFEHGLSWGALSTENFETRRLIEELCVAAAKETDFDREGRQLFVKAIPDFDGGCTFFLTLGAEDKNELYPVIFSTKNTEDMITAAKKLAESGLGENTSVYFNKDKRYIFVQERENRRKTAWLILSEYCTVEGHGKIAKLQVAESSTLVCSSSSELIRLIDQSPPC